jgi:membrane protein DedA with SNARE-associated domain
MTTLLTLGAATFVSEDAAALSAASLVAQGSLALWPASLTVALGIWLGDLGLWVAGRTARMTAGRLLWLRRWQPSTDQLDAAGRQLERHACLAIFASRVLPGSRLPLYFLAGAGGLRLLPFAAWTFAAVSAWTAVLFGVVAAFSAAFTDALGIYASIASVAVTLAALVTWRWYGAATEPVWLARLRRWEFWPPWLFYGPVAGWVAWLMITRGPRALSAANPGIEDGGFVGESKSAILSMLPAEWTLAHALLRPGTLEDRLNSLSGHFDRTGTTFPVILKPDVGQRGAGVRLVRSMADAAAYLADHPAAVVAQVYHPGPYEAGIFYYRLPGAPRGQVFSITDKRFPMVVGDGLHPLSALIEAHPRHRLQARTFLTRHRDRLAEVPAAGETIRLGVAGNHAQGTMFLDGSDLLTPALAARIDAISQRIDGFYIGRFDVRYRDPRALMAGDDLAIVELNGVTAEATHIYDPSRSLWSAYRTLFTQWRLVFDIGAVNLTAGRRSSSLRRLVTLSLAHLGTPTTHATAD